MGRDLANVGYTGVVFKPDVRVQEGLPMKMPWKAMAVVATAAALSQGSLATAQQRSPTGYYQPNLYNNPTQAYQFNRFYYYPYYYFPHNYWPTTGPRWPELPNECYMKPPA